MSSKRRKRSTTAEDAPRGEALLLFQVEGHDDAQKAAAAEERAVVRCSECGTPLRSEKSRAAGVSQRCAAQVGIGVLASLRRRKNAA